MMTTKTKNQEERERDERKCLASNCLNTRVWIKVKQKQNTGKAMAACDLEYPVRGLETQPAFPPSVFLFSIPLWEYTPSRVEIFLSSD